MNDAHGMRNWGLETKWALSTTSHPRNHSHLHLHPHPRVGLRLEEFDFKLKWQNCKCLEIWGMSHIQDIGDAGEVSEVREKCSVRRCDIPWLNFLIFSLRFYREMPHLPTLLQYSRHPEYVTLLKNIQWCISYIPSIFIGCGNLRVFRIMSSSISTKTCE